MTFFISFSFLFIKKMTTVFSFFFLFYYEGFVARTAIALVLVMHLSGLLSGLSGYRISKLGNFNNRHVDRGKSPMGRARRFAVAGERSAHNGRSATEYHCKTVWQSQIPALNQGANSPVSKAFFIGEAEKQGFWHGNSAHSRSFNRKYSTNSRRNSYSILYKVNQGDRKEVSELKSKLRGKMGVYAVVEVATGATLIRRRKSFSRAFSGWVGGRVVGATVRANPSAWEAHILHVEDKPKIRREVKKKTRQYAASRNKNLAQRTS